MDVQTTLSRIRDLLENHPGKSADWIESVIELGGRDEAGFYRELNSKRLWGGAGSIASEALAYNPGLERLLWRAQIRECPEQMIELGVQLQARGRAHPDMGSWLLAFSNWNQSEV